MTRTLFAVVPACVRARASGCVGVGGCFGVCSRLSQCITFCHCSKEVSFSQVDKAFETARSQGAASRLGLGFLTADYDRHLASVNGGRKDKTKRRRFLKSVSNCFNS